MHFFRPRDIICRKLTRSFFSNYGDKRKMVASDKQSRWIPGRYPTPGTSLIADAIRQRRGERGLTPLDGALLHVPPVAEGWNTLLGAVRTKGNLPGDIRELMVSVFVMCWKAGFLDFWVS